jgi:hypothetical protein
MSPNEGQQSSKSMRRLVVVGALLFLYLAGAGHWYRFLNRGDLAFNVGDWGKEHVYYSILQEALSEGRIPFHLSRWAQYTNRFLANPEVNLSPQIALLPFMSIGSFILCNTLIMYTIGFIGCLLLRRRFQLSLLPFTLLLLVFNFNGHIVSHIAVGHYMWSGYFFLPLFMLLLFDLADGRVDSRTWLKLAFVLFAIILQGSFHIFNWCIIFLVLFALANREHIKTIAAAIGGAFLLSAFRIIPAAMTFGDRAHPWTAGFPSPRHMLEALTVIRPITYQAPSDVWPYPWRWPEYDTYIGVVGLLLLLTLGVAMRFSKRPELERMKFPALDLPLALMALLSLNYFYNIFAWLPLFHSERVTSRFLIIPLLFVALLAAIRLEKLLLCNKSVKLRIILCAALLRMAFAFYDHSITWRLKKLQTLFSDVVFDVEVHIISMENEGIYKAAVFASALLSLFALIYMLYQCRYWNKPTS